MKKTLYITIATLFSLVLLFASLNVVSSQNNPQSLIDVELRNPNTGEAITIFSPYVTDAKVGDMIDIDLFVVSNTNTPQEFFGGQFILNWDANQLKLIGNEDMGDYKWLASYFPDDSGGDGLNPSFDDGDAWYLALARFDGLPQATSDGMLITTLQFEVVGIQTIGKIMIPEAQGTYTTTAILSADVPGEAVTGELPKGLIRIKQPSAMQRFSSVLRNFFRF